LPLVETVFVNDGSKLCISFDVIVGKEIPATGKGIDRVFILEV
jgi:hypothetical protein